MSEERQNPILQILLEMRAEMGNVSADNGQLVAAKSSFLRSEPSILRAEIASEIAMTGKELSAQIDSLRREAEGHYAAHLGRRRSFDASRTAPAASTNT